MVPIWNHIPVPKAGGLNTEVPGAQGWGVPGAGNKYPEGKMWSERRSFGNQVLPGGSCGWGGNEGLEQGVVAAQRSQILQYPAAAGSREAQHSQGFTR